MPTVFAPAAATPGARRRRAGRIGPRGRAHCPAAKCPCRRWGARPRPCCVLGACTAEQATTIDLDLAKNVFQVHGIDAFGKVLLRRKLHRGEVPGFFATLPPANPGRFMGMEACGGAHYWARELARLGHMARLMPPAYVKPYGKRGKTAEAIREAMTRPTMRFVPAKSEAQQAAAVQLRTRELLVRQHTQAVNALRAHLTEYEITAAQGAAKLVELIGVVRHDEDPHMGSGPAGHCRVRRSLRAPVQCGAATGVSHAADPRECSHHPCRPGRDWPLGRAHRHPGPALRRQHRDHSEVASARTKRLPGPLSPAASLTLEGYRRRARGGLRAPPRHQLRPRRPHFRGRPLGPQRAKRTPMR